MIAPAGIVSVVHTSFHSLDSFTALFEELAPDVTVRHVVDDDLLADVIAHGEATPMVKRRMSEHYQAAERSGSDLVFNPCSSVSEVATGLAPGLGIPVVNVDSRMARVACGSGSRVGIVATLETTLGPTRRLIESTARALQTSIDVEAYLVAEAFERLEAGDRDAHDRSVIDAVRDLAARTDVVVCAQGSMASVLPRLGDVDATVLTSPRLGVEEVVTVLRGSR